MAEPNFNEQNTSNSAYCMAFLPEKLNWRLTMYHGYNPSSYYHLVNHVHG